MSKTDRHISSFLSRPFRGKAPFALSAASSPRGRAGGVNKDFVDEPWSDQEVLSIFEGEWAGRIPGLKSGTVPLFDDERIHWLEKQCGGFSGKSILELGPMEGGHTYMLWKGGASSIVAIEGNKRSFLKCLVTKELLEYSAKFRLGDFSKYLAVTGDTYDFILACGVLYHMADPLRLLESLPRVSRSVGIWTHYFDEKTVLGTKHLRRRFDTRGEMMHWRGNRIPGYRQQYRREPNLRSFIGGSRSYSTWLRKEDIIGVLQDLGFTVVTGKDDLHAKNGPEILLYASR